MQGRAQRVIDPAPSGPPGEPLETPGDDSAHASALVRRSQSSVRIYLAHLTGDQVERV